MLPSSDTFTKWFDVTDLVQRFGIKGEGWADMGSIQVWIAYLKNGIDQFGSGIEKKLYTQINLPFNF